MRATHLTGMFLAPLRDVFVARRRREWRGWARRPNYEFIQSSPRGIAVPLRRYLPGACPFISKVRARKKSTPRMREVGRGGERQRWNAGRRVERTWGRLCGIPAATYGNVIRAFRRMLSCVFALLRNRPRVRVTLVLPDKGNQCQCALRLAAYTGWRENAERERRNNDRERVISAQMRVNVNRIGRMLRYNDDARHWEFIFPADNFFSRW